MYLIFYILNGSAVAVKHWTIISILFPGNIFLIYNNQRNSCLIPYIGTVTEPESARLLSITVYLALSVVLFEANANGLLWETWILYPELLVFFPPIYRVLDLS